MSCRDCTIMQPANGAAWACNLVHEERAVERDHEPAVQEVIEFAELLRELGESPTTAHDPSFEGCAIVDVDVLVAADLLVSYTTHDVPGPFPCLLRSMWSGQRLRADTDHACTPCQ